MRILCILLFFFVIAFQSVLGEGLEEALKQIQDRDYPTAVKTLQSISELEKKPELLYILGNTCYLAGDYQSANKYLDLLLQKHPDSSWKFKAKYKKADVALKEKKFEAAYLTYKTQVQRLTQGKRKAELASIYLKYADKFFKPADPDINPDYSKALNLYKEAGELQLAKEQEKKVFLQQALCYYHLRNYHQAIKILEDLKSGCSKEETQKGDLYEMVMYHLADSYYLKGQKDQARLLLKDFLAEFPKSKLVPKALYQISLTYNFPNPYTADDLENGIRVLKQLITQYSTHKLSPAGAYNIATACFNRNQYDRAIEEFKKVKGVAGASKETQAEFSALASLMIGYCYSYQKKFDEAEAAWQNYLRLYPNHKRWTSIQKEVINLEYNKGDEFYKLKKWEKTRNQWRDFLNQYPLDSRAANIMYFIGETFHSEKNWDAAIREWTKLIQKFPRTNPSSHAQFEIGRIYELELNNFPKAMETYRTLNWGSYYNQAQQRLREMKDKSLKVVTERIFLSNETPTLKLTTRNFESVKVKVYEVDLLSYFRKMNTIAGIENLDLALIEPDETYDFKIEDYEKYRLLEKQLPLPKRFQRQGVYAINISTDTIEAFSVVVVSDIALILKATKSDVLIFAENMVAKKPAEKVDIFVSDGKSLIFEGKTNEKGFYYLEDKKLKNIKNLRVFGTSPQGNASNELNLRKLSYSVGLKPRGYLYTDRPAYRPGEEVNIRGIIREIKDSVYHFKENDKYTLQVRTPEGKQIYSSSVALNSFGTVHGKLKIPTGSSLGTYRIKLSQREGSTFNGSFKVQEYQLERFKVSINTEKPYYYRGETIKGTIKVEYYYGEPVVGQKVSFGITNQGTETQKTNDKGEVSFTLATNDYQEKQLLRLWANVDGENISSEQKIWITTKGFEISLSSLRKVFLTSEPFDINVKAKDIAEKGVKTELTYEVFHLINTNGKIAEKKVQNGTVQTTEEGNGVFRLTLKEGGKYRIRARGEDRFKNGITGTSELTISGEDDKEKLRILTDTDQFKVGDEATVQIIWRGEESLALITYEGEQIYKSYLAPLKKGKNLLKLQMTNLLSPNFALGVAVMEKNKFNHVQKSFTVSRNLQIKVSTNKKVYRPGEEVEVEIETTDSQGKGIVSEVSLAVVDEALLSLYPDKLPSITSFFYGQKRTIRIATSATNTFTFQGRTSEISKELLQELQKAKEADKRADRSMERARFKSARESLKKEMAELEEMEEDFDDESFGVGGGKGGKYGGRFGGKKSLTKRGGGGRRAKANLAGAFEDMERLRQQFLTTAYWNPSLVTKSNGKKKIKFTLPDNTTSWRLMLYGVNQEILVGKAVQSIKARKDFLVELKTPKMLVEKDTPSPLVTVHNNTEEELTTLISLKTKDAKESKSTSIEVKIKPNSMVERYFPIAAVRQGELILTASAKSGKFSDQVVRSVQVQPLATKVQRGTGGLATHSFKQKLALPKNKEKKKYFNNRVGIRYGPSLSSILLDGELLPLNDGTTIAANGLTAYHTLSYLEAIGAKTGAKYSKWFGDFESAILHLLLNQNPDGGFSYSGLNRSIASQRRSNINNSSIQSDPNVSSLCFRLLVFGKARGIEGLDNAISQGALYLKNAFSRTTLNSEKATILYGLSGTKEIDFAYVNRLYRERNTLDSYSLALLTLTFSNMNRKEYAKELAGLLAKRDIYTRPKTRRLGRENRQNLCWAKDPIELIALATNAFIQAKLARSIVDKNINYLLASRQHKNWGSPKANAAATEAISNYLSSYKPTKQDRYDISILVNNKVVHKAKVSGSQEIKEFYVSISKPNATVEFRVAGSVNIAYQMKIEGWLKGLSKQDQNSIIRVKHLYTPSPLRYKGKDVKRGFGVLSGSYRKWTNEIRNLAEGDFTEVVLSYSPRRQSETYDSYLVLEEAIPGGTTVLEPTIKGDFQNYEMRDGKVVFYLNRQYGTIKYRLYGYLQGNYQVLPSKVWNLFEPYRMSTGVPIKLTVMKRGATSPDKFEPTPTELYNLGKYYFEDGHFKEAKKYLEKLFANENLQQSYYKEVTRMLLFIAIEMDNSKAIVRYFEILKERYPKLFINFTRIIRIGSAYGDLKEFERGMQVFKATMEANFLKEANVSGTLNEQGEFLSSIDFMLNLLKNYPDLPVIQTALYSLSQFIYESADKALNIPEIQKKKLTRGDLIRKAANVVKGFLVLHPENPQADEASFSHANMYLDLKEYQKALNLCQILSQRFKNSNYLDDFLYIEGYANFYLRKYEEALKLLQRLATERFPSGKNRTAYSENRYLAQYIIGQIYHSRGEIEKAIEYYQKIDSRFEDAKDTIDYFQEKHLSLKEISTFKVGEPVSIELKHRNIKKVDIKVYKVDLMKLYLIKKNLNQITNIHLAGIKPTHSRVEEFKDAYREIKTKLTLPLEKEGAYLVVAKGEDQDCSGMALLSDLKLNVQEDMTSGTVRVNVLSAKNNAFVDQAHVKIIGSISNKFKSGNTDLRGIFVADDIQGAATAIVKKKNQYAFYRGEAPLRSRTRRPLRQQKTQKLDQLIEDINLQNRQRQSQQLKQLFEEQDEYGVEIENTK